MTRGAFAWLRGAAWSPPRDDRRDPGYGLALPAQILHHARRTCYLIGDGAIATAEAGRARLHHQINGNFNGLCPDERWWCQPVVLERNGEAHGSFGYTGYLVAADLVLTCWHGWEHFQHARQLAVFDYVAGHGCDVPVDLPIASIVEVAATPVFGPDEALESDRCVGDWVLLRLARPVARALTPLQFATPTPGARAYTLGYPLGLPLKLADGGRVLGVEGATMRVDLDTFTGNSGSPVFDADSHALIGLVSEGQPGYSDFAPNAARRCYQYRRIDSDVTGTVCVTADCFAESVSACSQSR